MGGTPKPSAKGLRPSARSRGTRRAATQLCQYTRQGRAASPLHRWERTLVRVTDALQPAGRNYPGPLPRRAFPAPGRGQVRYSGRRWVVQEGPSCRESEGVRRGTIHRALVWPPRMEGSRGLKEDYETQPIQLASTGASPSPRQGRVLAHLLIDKRGVRV